MIYSKETLELYNKYDKCIGGDGEVKLVGREACMELIEICEKLSGEKGKYGNKETGMLNVTAIKYFVYNYK